MWYKNRCIKTTVAHFVRNGKCEIGAFVHKNRGDTPSIGVAKRTLVFPEYQLKGLDKRNFLSSVRIWVVNDSCIAFQ